MSRSGGGLARGTARRPRPSAAPRSAVASLAVAPLVEGPPRPGRVFAVFDRACYLSLDGAGPMGVLAVVAPRSVRLPNALVLQAPLRAAAVGAPVDAGAGSLRVGEEVVYADRRWDPRPRLRPTTPQDLSARAAAARSLSRPSSAPATAVGRAGSVDAFAQAVTRLDAPGSAAAADRLLGAGPGLTPAGDDVLAGFLAAARTLPAALPAGPWPAPLADVATAVVDAVLPPAPERTTLVSAALLEHAARGHAATPVAALLAALTGSGDPQRAAERLRRVGHTSGAALGEGVLLAVRALLAVWEHDRAETGVGSSPLPVPAGPSGREER